MHILHECKKLKEGFAASRDSTDPLDSEKLITEYSALFNRIQLDDTHTHSEVQAISDLNIAFVRYQLATEVDQELTREAIKWNFRHQEEIGAEALVNTYAIRAKVDLLFGAAAFSTILADSDEAICIAYCDQTCTFSTVAEMYRIRSSILERMGMRHYVEARESEREAVRLEHMENDYQKLIRSIKC